MVNNPLSHDEYVIFDFETTGFIPGMAEVIQMAALKVLKDGTREMLVEYLINEKGWNQEAERVHGISQQMVEEQGITQTEAWTKLSRFMGKELPLIGHNIVGFDVKFLDYEFSKRGLARPERSRFIDTAMIFKGKKLGFETEMMVGDHYSYSLQTSNVKAAGVYFKLTQLMDELSLDVAGLQAHTADADVLMTEMLYRAWCENTECEPDELKTLYPMLTEIKEQMRSLYAKGNGGGDSYGKLKWKEDAIKQRIFKVEAKRSGNANQEQTLPF